MKKGALTIQWGEWSGYKKGDWENVDGVCFEGKD